MDATTPLPTGTVTFLFTDIEGSTRLWEQHPQSMEAALARHDALLRDAIQAHQGHVFKTIGDQFCAAFASPTEALIAAVEAQRALCAEAWEPTGPLRVRMALHTGAAQEREGDYFGPTVNRVARLLAAAHGGQLLLSRATEERVRERLPDGARLRDLGSHRLKDLQQPEQLFQLLHPSLPDGFPPVRSLEAFAHNLPVQLTSFIGREREMAEVKRLLAETHLLTLTGSGGCGKTFNSRPEVGPSDGGRPGGGLCRWGLAGGAGRAGGPGPGAAGRGCGAGGAGRARPAAHRDAHRLPAFPLIAAGAGQLRASAAGLRRARGAPAARLSPAPSSGEQPGGAKASSGINSIS